MNFQEFFVLHDTEIIRDDKKILICFLCFFVCTVLKRRCATPFR